MQQSKETPSVLTFMERRSVKPLFPINQIVKCYMDTLLLTTAPIMVEVKILEFNPLPILPHYLFITIDGKYMGIAEELLSMAENNSIRGFKYIEMEGRSEETIKELLGWPSSKVKTYSDNLPLPQCTICEDMLERYIKQNKFPDKVEGDLFLEHLKIPDQSKLHLYPVNQELSDQILKVEFEWL